jgi:hypothetical protein
MDDIDRVATQFVHQLFEARRGSASHEVHESRHLSLFDSPKVNYPSRKVKFLPRQMAIVPLTGRGDDPAADINPARASQVL